MNKFFALIKILLITILVFVSIYFINYSIFRRKTIPYFFNISHLQAIGESMFPTIKDGEMLIIYKSKKYEVNDIVCFYNGDNIITHRIVNINNNIVTTKGDNNKEIDKNITYSQIIGKVIFVL